MSAPIRLEAAARRQALSGYRTELPTQPLGEGYEVSYDGRWRMDIPIRRRVALGSRGRVRLLQEGVSERLAAEGAGPEWRYRN